MASSLSQQQQQRAVSPHRTVVWTEPNKSKMKKKKVAVVYYLCREDGQLEHPHFMEVPAEASSHLCLRDFTERLDMVRGSGMAAMYSWSSKRSYRNQGFVWHDLTDDDVIHPAAAAAHQQAEYILKGSHRRFSLPSHGPRRRNNWNSFDLAEYKHQQQHAVPNATQEEQKEEDISPPPPSSSPDDEDTLQPNTRMRMRASSVLMQLISCSSITIKKTHSHSHHKNASPPPQDRDYFSGSLLIDDTNNSRNNKTLSLSLKKSSSCNADSFCRRLQVGEQRGLKQDTRSGECE